MTDTRVKTSGDGLAARAAAIVQTGVRRPPPAGPRHEQADPPTDPTYPRHLTDQTGPAGPADTTGTAGPAAEGDPEGGRGGGWFEELIRVYAWAKPLGG